MPDRNDEDDQNLMMNRIDDPIIADAHAIEIIMSSEFLRARWDRLLG